MRNYVIINGVNSLTIQGLAIKTMPPITKPIQRTLREEIDGRDGDLVTELGYGAYDKTIEIGLFGTFNIDEVIAYFNQKGTITFSNEADKVYYFQALEQVDYAELLKFRTANVVLHCQPFKYPVTETPLVEEYEYVTGTGTNITLDNTEETLFNEIELQGNTSQTQYTGKNLYNDNFSDYTQPVNYRICPITLTQGQTYVLKGNKIGTNITGVVVAVVPYGEQYTDFSAQLKMAVDSGGNGHTLTFTPDSTWTSPKLAVYSSDETTFNNIFTNYEVQLEKGSSATSFEPFVGGIPSPNPSFPQPIQVVSGDNTIDIVGKNLFDENTILTSSNFTYSNGYYTGLSNDLRSYMSANRDIINFKENTQYTVSLTGYLGNATNVRVRFVYTDLEWTETTYLTSSSSRIMGTSTAGKTIAYIILNYSTAGTIYIKDFQVEESATATSYEPYQSQSYAVNLGTLELCKIGDYQDYIYKEGKKWYKYNAIGKVVLNGSENWSDFSVGDSNFRCQYDVALPNILTPPTNPAQLFSNYFKAISRDNAYAKTEIGIAQYGSTLGKIFICAPNTILSEQTLAQWKTWLSTHNTIVYYVLATPTINPITDEDLIEQLEALWNANSYRGQTNITQTSNDLPFMMEVSALKLGSDHLEVENTGNVYSKPTIELEGTGIVDIYLNDVQVFEVDLSEVNHIVIDTEKMEAYNPTDNTLANRKVTGDYSTFKLNVGTNDLRFSGDLTSATITRYKRWL